VYKHAVKTDLLPYEDRVNMCKLAVAPFQQNPDPEVSISGTRTPRIEVSTIEKEVGESNAPMLKALKKQYPAGSRLLWICGDDFFSWIEHPKGIETMAECSGIIVQRRLHCASSDRFFKEPIDDAKIRAIGARLNVDIDFIYGGKLCRLNTEHLVCGALVPY